MSDVTTDDILDAIRASMKLAQTEHSSDGATGTEIAQALNCCPLTAREHIRRLVEEKRMVVVRLRRNRIDGVPTVVSGYRLVV